jgi:nicotinamidase-related amidase
MARVWDRFLTDQDKAHLAHDRDRRVGFGKRPAVLNVDLYRWVFGDEPLPLLEGVELWPGYTGLAGWNAIPHIQRLLGEARAASVPILYVTGMAEEDSGVTGWSAAIHHGAVRRGASEDPLAQDRYRRRYEIIGELAPEAGDVVLRKTAPSAFWGTPLMAQLNHLGIDTLLITGESTSGCVRASVVDAASYRFRVQVVEECVFDRHEACHAINLFDMHQKYADVISVDNAVEYLRRLNSGAIADGSQRELAGVS